MGSGARRRGLRLYVNFNDAATIGTTCDQPLPWYGTPRGPTPAAPVENLCRFYFNKLRIKLGMRRRAARSPRGRFSLFIPYILTFIGKPFVALHAI